MKYGPQGGEDPSFANVHLLISDMIAKLEEDVGNDARAASQLRRRNCKGQCPNSGLDSLLSRIYTAASASAKLKEDVKDLEAELAKF